MKQSLKTFVASLLTSTLLLSGLFAGTAAAHGQDQNQKRGFCVPLTIPVAMAQGQPFNQRISGTYCQPFAWQPGQHQVDVLTSGSTYTGSYWDWPVNPSLYSYVNKTLDARQDKANAGRATFTYDRMGSGKSSHPVSTDITITTDAYVLHEIVQGLRLLGYKQVNSIAHSLGSGIALREAATFKDVSRVVLTGYLHTPSNPAVVAGNYPANQDPAFAGQNLDNGYITTKPGVRGTSFYSSSADPGIVAYDELHKDLTSSTGLGGYFVDRAATAGANLSNQINVPVLLVDGQQDFIFCFNPAVLDCSDQNGVKTHEVPYYTGAPSVTAYTIANTGHDVALHPSADQSFQLINKWIKTN